MEGTYTKCRQDEAEHKANRETLHSGRPGQGGTVGDLEGAIGKEGGLEVGLIVNSFDRRLTIGSFDRLTVQAHGLKPIGRDHVR